MVFYVLDFYSHILVLDSGAGGVVLDLKLSDQKIVIQNYQYAALEDGNWVILRTTTFITLSVLQGLLYCSLPLELCNTSGSDHTAITRLYTSMHGSARFCTA